MPHIPKDDLMMTANLTANSYDSICVFCSASTQVSDYYKDCATQVGTALAKAGKRLVYGGGSRGLMGACADAAMAAGGEVVGVIPQFLYDIEVANNNITNLIVVEDMHNRKMEMFSRSDAILVLPGGFGTLEEMLEVITWKQLRQHDKPIIIGNINNFWDSFIAMIAQLKREKFLHSYREDMFVIAQDVTSIMACLDT